MGKMYTVRQIAKMLNVTTYTVRRWARMAKIKAVKMPENSKKSQWFVSEDEIKRLMNGDIK